MMFLGLAFLAGAVLPLAFAPFSLAPVAVLSLVGLLLAWRGCNARQAAQRGYLFGLGYFGFGVYWVYFSIHHFAYAPLPLAIVIMLGLVAILALYPALLGYVLNRFVADAGWVRYLAAFPLLWVLLEGLRGWLFTGFPWLLLGYSQIDTWLAGWGPISGVLGMSWAVALTAGGAMLLIGRLAKRWHGVAMTVLIWLAGWGLTGVPWTQTAGPSLKVALVQANIPQEIKWLPDLQARTLDIYVKLTRQHWDADVVVWPETAIPAFYHRVRDAFLPYLTQQAKAHATDVVLGIPVQSSTSRDYYNGLLSTAQMDRFYLKQHLVPLGEYVPLKPLTSFILDWMQIPLSDFSAGPPGQPLLQAGGYPFASSICYEDVFEHASRDGLPEAAYLVNVSNDTWFGDTIAPAQHLQMARMRALESGRYLLRATNTGITAVIDDRGVIVNQAPMFRRHVLRSEFLPKKGATPYVAWWGEVRWLLVFLLVGLVLGFRNKGASRYKA